MDISQVIKDMNNRRSSIDKIYNDWMERIDQWKLDIDNIPYKYGNRSKQFQENEKMKLYNKINDLQQRAEQWLSNQISEVETWLKNKQNDIQKQLEKKEKEILKSRKNFEKINTQTE